jgi:hypothetical protein
MKSPVEESSMYDDPTTPSHVRELLSAGRRANAAYDVDRGLAKHLAAIAATAPAAHWAPAAAVRSGLPAWFGYVAMPLAAASVAGLLWLYSADRQASGAGARTSSSAPAPSEAAGVRIPSSNPAAASAPSSDQSAALDLDDTEARGSDDSRQGSALERRRSGVRSNAATSAHVTSNTSNGHTGRPSAGVRGASDGDLNGVAAVSGDSFGPDTRDNHGNNKPGDGISSRNAAADSNAASEARTAPAADSNSAAQRAAADEPAQAARPASAEANAKPAPVVDESRLEREMQMLAVTQRVLSSDPARALRLSEQGEREFSGSMFSAERRQLGLLALVKLGRLDEARRAGRPFLAHYPKAPWSERLRRALVTGVVD